MKFSAFAPLAVASVLVSPLASHGALSVYSQNFDSLAPAETNSNNALGDDGWLVFANVFNTDGSYAGGYGAAAPNWFRSFSAVGTGGSVPVTRTWASTTTMTTAPHRTAGSWSRRTSTSFGFLTPRIPEPRRSSSSTPGTPSIWSPLPPRGRSSVTVRQSHRRPGWRAKDARVRITSSRTHGHFRNRVAEQAYKATACAGVQGSGCAGLPATRRVDRGRRVSQWPEREHGSQVGDRC